MEDDVKVKILRDVINGRKTYNQIQPTCSAMIAQVTCCVCVGHVTNSCLFSSQLVML